MRVDGTAVVWDVPAGWVQEEAVRLIVSDAGGLEMAYTFSLAAKDR
jgi:hypothetical protein